MKKNIFEWLNGPIIDVFDEVRSDNAQASDAQTKKEKDQTSSSLKDVLNAFLASLFRWLILGLAVALFLALAFVRESGFLSLELDGQTYVALAALVVGIAISVSGALVAIVLSWRSLKLSESLDTLEKKADQREVEAHERDLARFILDVRAPVSECISTIKPKLEAWNNSLEDFVSKASQLRDAVKKMLRSDSVHQTDLAILLISHIDLSEETSVKRGDFGNSEFAKSAQGLLKLQEELALFDWASNAAIKVVPQWERRITHQRLFQAYAFSVQFVLSDSEFMRTWFEKSAKLDEHGSILRHPPPIRQLSGAATIARDGDLVFAFALLGLALSDGDEFPEKDSMQSLFSAFEAVFWHKKEALVDFAKRVLGGQAILDSAIETNVLRGNFGIYPPSYLSELETFFKICKGMEPEAWKIRSEMESMVPYLLAWSDRIEELLSAHEKAKRAIESGCPLSEVSEEVHNCFKLIGEFATASGSEHDHVSQAIGLAWPLLLDVHEKTKQAIENGQVIRQELSSCFELIGGFIATLGNGRGQARIDQAQKAYELARSLLNLLINVKCRIGGAGGIAHEVAKATVQWTRKLELQTLAIQCCSSEWNERESAYRMLLKALEKSIEHFAENIQYLIANPTLLEQMYEVISILESKAAEQREIESEKIKIGLTEQEIGNRLIWAALESDFAFKGVDELTEATANLRSRLDEFRVAVGA